MSVIESEEQKQILTIRMNRPDKHNALNPEMIESLSEVAAKVRSREDLRAVVLMGNGPSFSAGADLAWMKESINDSGDKNIQSARVLYDLFQFFYDLPMPVIAQVHGAAMGGAIGLIAVSDLCVASTETVFSLSEVRVGLVPSVISPFLYRKMVAKSALHWALTGQRFSAAEAFNAGLVTQVVADQDLQSSVQRLAESFLKLAPQAVRATKKLFRSVAASPYEVHKRETSQTIAQIRISPEGQEGLRAFLEKRKPNWVLG